MIEIFGVFGDEEPRLASRGRGLADQLNQLGLEARYLERAPAQQNGTRRLRLVGGEAEAEVQSRSGELAEGAGTKALALEGEESLLERALRLMAPDFDSLPLLTEGESKIVRLWTGRMVMTKLKPTVYSYTANRYGSVDGTDEVRARFTAALYRRLMREQSWADTDAAPVSAFLAEVESLDGPLLVQRRVEDCNLETRVKRYHIGSPLHRYLYTERHPTTRAGGGPLKRWSRLDRPVVCFDWRHPLLDDTGRRLADEPISDDYAAVWMHDVPHAKAMARQTFVWMEELFAAGGVRLIDMCLFIDRQGRTIYGEVSPDCMRLRLGLADPAEAEAGAKDVWRQGDSAELLLDRYREIHHRVFEGTGPEDVEVPEDRALAS